MSPFQREKLLHAIVFFKENTRYCNKLKVYKLLHHLDFEIFRQTGRSSTGLAYYAWPMGPVPQALQNEFRRPPADMLAVFGVRTEPSEVADRVGALIITPRVPFNGDLFTKRELAEMERLAEVYYEAQSGEMTEASHDGEHPHGFPWHQVHDVEGRHNALIPYELALDDRPDSIDKERADELAIDAGLAASLFR